MDKSVPSEEIRRSNVELHRKEAFVYDAIHPEIYNAYEQHRIERDLEQIALLFPLQNDTHILDIGCGTGNLTLKYLKRGYHVKAVDISPEMIAVLRSKTPSETLSRVELAVQDAEDLLRNIQTLGTWDLISFSSVLHHLPDFETVLALALEQLRLGGVLYVCHEPLARIKPQKPSWNLAWRMLSYLDTGYIYALKFLIYLWQSVRIGRWFGRMDYRLSDYHAEAGIDIRPILHRLETLGAKVILFEAYRNHYTAFFTAMDERFCWSPPTEFRFIIQRQ